MAEPINFTLFQNQVWRSLQGEGHYSGVPTVFVRFAKCISTYCSSCDTMFDSWGQSTLTIDELAESILVCLSSDINWVCFTGGEPLLQKHTDLMSLINKLRLENTRIKISMETLGAFIPSDGLLGLVDFWSISPKTSWAEIGPPKIAVIARTVLHAKDWQLKFVIKTKKDFDEAKEIVSCIPRTSGSNKVFVQPFDGGKTDKSLPVETLAAWVLAEASDFRLSEQSHKRWKLA